MNLDNRISPSASSINQTSVPPKSNHTVGNLSSYGETSPLKQISVNQVIRGEVTDLRNNEVTVTLNDGTTVTGKLNNGSLLSIGDTAAFKISTVQPYIELEALPQNASFLENATIQKALESAGLPKTEKNQLVVHELMNCNMPIGKQSIQNILQQSYQFKDVPIRTLVVMNRHNIPLTAENITQFEAYRKMEHQILARVNAFSESIPSLLQMISAQSPAPVASAFGNQLLGILLSGSETAGHADGSSISSLGPEERQALQSVLSNVPLGEEDAQRIQNGTLSLRETIHLLNHGMEQAYQFDKNNLQIFTDEAMAAAKQAGTVPNMVQIEADLADIPKVLDSYDEPVVHELFSRFSQLQHQNNELAAVLNPEERQQFVHLLENFSLSGSDRQLLLNGEITLHDTLSMVKTALPAAAAQSIIELFDSSLFQTVLREHITSNWTLKPEDLEKDGAVEKLYQKMYTQSSELSNFFHATLGNSEIGSSLSQQAGDMRQNMDFMQMLNQMFSYVQIPLKLKEQNAHSELYVYTKKRALKEHPENISVLLHLDLEKLGPLDIYVALQQTDVTAKFYLPDKVSRNLFRDNIGELKNALQQKGYSVSAEFMMREKEIDIVKDFMEAESAGGDIKRYTFDIRA